MKVSIIGQGYVGLPLALVLVRAGHRIVGIDLDKSLVEKIKSGSSPIGDISNENIAEALATNNYSIENNYDAIATSEVVIICVPTPLDSDRKPDNSYLVNAVNSIASNMHPKTLIINESTVAPGTTRGLIKETLDKAGVDYDLAYSPERIDPANKKWNVTNTPKLVAGLTPKATDRAAAFYRTFV